MRIFCVHALRYICTHERGRLQWDDTRRTKDRDLKDCTLSVNGELQGINSNARKLQLRARAACIDPEMQNARLQGYDPTVRNSFPFVLLPFASLRDNEQGLTVAQLRRDSALIPRRRLQ
jgi:hypothetical protein